MRLYEMFIGDFEKSAPWNTSSIKGCQPLSGARLEPAGYSCGRRRLSARSWKTRSTSTIKKVTRGYRGAQIQHRHRRHDEPAQRDLLTEAAITRGRVRNAADPAQPVCPAHHRGALAAVRLRGAACPREVAGIRRGEMRGGHGGDRRAGERQAARQADGGHGARPRRTPLLPQRRSPMLRKRWRAKPSCKEIYVPGKLVNIAVR